MRKRGRCLTGLLLLGSVGAAALLGAVLLPEKAAGRGSTRPAYLDGPPPGHTGGFGEPTCRSCHFDHPLAADTGRLEVHGFPERFRPGSTYVLTVEIQRTGLERAGFQLAIRRDSGSGRGRSAGSLSAPSERVQLLTGEGGRVVYAQHTRSGSEPSVPGTHSAAWHLRWRAPDRRVGVLLHVTANAANGDDSEFGDHIYARRLASEASFREMDHPGADRAVGR